jgi:hypothetical protein
MTENSKEDKKLGPRYQKGRRSEAWELMFGDQKVKPEESKKKDDKDTKK